MSTRDGRRSLDGRRAGDRPGRADRCGLVAPQPTRRLRSRGRGVELRALVEPRWQEQAACASADPEAWFPRKGRTPVRQVSRICAGCPVNRSCLAVAMLWNEDGIWAGTNPGHRTQGYRLLRHGVSAATVLELLLAQAQRPPIGSRTAGQARLRPRHTCARTRERCRAVTGPAGRRPREHHDRNGPTEPGGHS